MCRTLNPLDQLHKKWILRIVLKTPFAYCSLNSANPYTLMHLNYGGSIQNDNTDSKWDFLKEELMPRSQSVALQPKLWGILGIPPPPQRKKKKKRTKKLEMLSYPHF